MSSPIPTKVHHIGHAGTHFTVPGIHLSEPSPQRTPVIFQAGASPRGVRFAAENAEAIFTAAPTKAILRETVTTIRRELELAGRDPYAAKIFNLTTVITAETDEEARAKHAEYLSYGDPEGALVFMSGWMGVDLAALRTRRADRQRRLQRHPVGGEGLPVRRPRRRRMGGGRTSPTGARSVAWGR